MKTGGHVAWLTCRQAAEYLGYIYEHDVVRDGKVVHRAGDVNVDAFYQLLYVERRRTPRRLTVHWLRGKMRFRRVELDALLQPESESESSSESASTGLRVVERAS
jgi:hypothetical protein